MSASPHRKLLNIELARLSPESFKSAPKAPIAVVLDNIRSAHNVGSVFRSADAFRIEEICLCGICATPPSALIHKSALGAEETVDWKYFDDTLDALEYLRSKGYRIACVEQTQGSIPLPDFTPLKGERYAYVLGNEVDGVQQHIVDASDFSIEVPQWGTKHSLNVSVCIGVILWHFRSRLL